MLLFSNFKVPFFHKKSLKYVNRFFEKINSLHIVSKDDTVLFNNNELFNDLHTYYQTQTRFATWGEIHSGTFLVFNRLNRFDAALLR